MPTSIDSAVLLEAARRGDRRSLARLITGVEGSDERSRTIVAEVYPKTGHAWTTGLTGSPGAGKSSLTNYLISHARTEERTVAVVAVDPSSPFTGGAILGDRVRMQEHIEDSGVYIRSMASRGQLGGLAAATSRVVLVVDALGFDEVFVETVGVGQAEVDVAANVDTTVVVVNPGWGDAVQTAKAGLLEVGDVFVVNKADRPGVDEAVRDLNSMLDLNESQEWRPPVVQCVALTGEGTRDVWAAVAEHRAFLERGQKADARRSRRKSEFRRALTRRYTERASQLISSSAGRAKGEQVAELVLDPWTAADELAWEVIR
jgi:GTPase